MNPDIKTLDLRDVSVILLRRGSRLRAEDLSKVKLPPSVTQTISIIVVDDFDDLEVISEETMREAGWVRNGA